MNKRAVVLNISACDLLFCYSVFVTVILLLQQLILIIQLSLSLFASSRQNVSLQCSRYCVTHTILKSCFIDSRHTCNLAVVLNLRSNLYPVYMFI